MKYVVRYRIPEGMITGNDNGWRDSGPYHTMKNATWHCEDIRGYEGITRAHVITEKEAEDVHVSNVG